MVEPCRASLVLAGGKSVRPFRWAEGLPCYRLNSRDDATGGGRGRLLGHEREQHPRASSRGGHELDIDANTRFHIQDRLGSASLVLDHEGKVIARSTHAPYGERWIDEQTKGTRPSDYRFTDKEEDLLSGAIYIGARHYLPAVGRWASPDPFRIGRYRAKRHLSCLHRIWLLP